MLRYQYLALMMSPQAKPHDLIVTLSFARQVLFLLFVKAPLHV